jgi:4-hydroxybenzoate polyprenyltransferase
MTPSPRRGNALKILRWVEFDRTAIIGAILALAIGTTVGGEHAGVVFAVIFGSFASVGLANGMIDREADGALPEVNPSPKTRHSVGA